MKAPASTIVWMTPNKARAFCDYLNRRFADSLPAGYVFRLPTIAEYYYLLNRSYPSLFKKGTVLGNLSGIPQDQIADLIGKEDRGNVKDIRWELKVTARDLFSRLSPDKYGFVGLIQHQGMFFLDQFSLAGKNPRYMVTTKNSTKDKADSADVSYFPRKREIDPVGCDAGTSLYYLTGFGIVHRNPKGRFSEFFLWGPMAFDGSRQVEGVTFRVVLGPDLLSEKKAR